MPEIQNIATAAIDPDSTVNVRREKVNVNEAVATVKLSIAKNGYWSSSPITIRPHPDQASPFKYENVVGQSRLRACLELGRETIPAVVQDLDDDAAIQQSWSENEFSTSLTISDKAYWFRKISVRCAEEGRPIADARKITAAFFNCSEQKVIAHLPLTGLPEEAKTMLDEGRLQIQDATVVAKHTYNPKHPAESEQKIMERVEWIMGLNVDERKAARKVIPKLGPEAPIDQLATVVERELGTDIIKISLPKEFHQRLIDWGNERGLIGASQSVIISRMITETLPKSE